MLREVYSATHPAARSKRPETPAVPARDAQAEAELIDALAANPKTTKG